MRPAGRGGRHDRQTPPAARPALPAPPWAANAEYEHRILGSAMRCLDTTPIMTGPLLDPTHTPDWGVDEAIQFTPRRRRPDRHAGARSTRTTASASRTSCEPCGSTGSPRPVAADADGDPRRCRGWTDEQRLPPDPLRRNRRPTGRRDRAARRRARRPHRDDGGAAARAAGRPAPGPAAAARERSLVTALRPRAAGNDRRADRRPEPGVCAPTAPVRGRRRGRRARRRAGGNARAGLRATAAAPRSSRARRTRPHSARRGSAAARGALGLRHAGSGSKRSCAA